MAPAGSSHISRGEVPDVDSVCIYPELVVKEPMRRDMRNPVSRLGWTIAQLSTPADCSVLCGEAASRDPSVLASSIEGLTSTLRLTQTNQPETPSFRSPLRTRGLKPPLVFLIQLTVCPEKSTFRVVVVHHRASSTVPLSKYCRGVRLQNDWVSMFHYKIFRYRGTQT